MSFEREFIRGERDRRRRDRFICECREVRGDHHRGGCGCHRRRRRELVCRCREV
ncbi:hypothetical protein SPD48_17270 [Pseudogracilibacillus sp. SE30717A]|uniref:hypothetical protein n=1 Tax=Pseudogracilibacillus sp. SE30717A TaxID=3098293 RepID=UPI00300DF933